MWLVTWTTDLGKTKAERFETETAARRLYTKLTRSGKVQTQAIFEPPKATKKDRSSGKRTH